MKIAVFIYSLEGGGAERVVSQLIPYLEQKDYDVHLVLMNPKCDFTFSIKNEAFLLEKNDGTEYGILKLLRIPFSAYKYHKFLKKNKINKSISFLAKPNFISVFSKVFNKYRKVIISERSYPSWQYGSNSVKSKVNRFLIKKLYPKADLLITNSEGNAKDLELNFKVPGIQLRTVNNPIDISKLDTIDSFEGFDKNFFNMISLGRLNEGKNHKLLIKSMVQFKSRKARLYIFGKGDLLNELNSLIHNLNLKEQVFLMGFEPNPYKYLKAADLFVFGSNYEGFPNVLLEAMGSGLPVISTNCPSGPNEILNLDVPYDCTENHYSKVGILVPLNSEEKMSDAISYMINNPDYYNSCKKNLLENLKRFERTLILDEYKTLIESV